MENEIEKRDLCLLAFELGITAASTCKTIEVFGHEGSLLTSWAWSLGRCDLATLVNLVVLVCHLCCLLLLMSLHNMIQLNPLQLFRIRVYSCNTLSDSNPKTGV